VSTIIHDRRIDMLGRKIVFQPDGEVPHDDGYRLVVPETSGVYLFFDLRGPLYVGKADNLRRRFCNHFDSHNQQLTTALEFPVGTVRFLWVQVPSTELATTEAQIIEELCPICNIRLNSRREKRQRRCN